MRPLRLAEQADRSGFCGAKVVQKWCKSGAERCK